MKPSIPAVALLLALAACREPDRPSAPSMDFDVAVDSDPRGADIYIDGTKVGATPDTLLGLTSEDHSLAVRLDTADLTYGFAGTIRPVGDSLLSLIGPLLLSDAFQNYGALHTAAGIDFATRPVGALFSSGQQGTAGVFWPSGSTNEYVAVGSPVIAGLFTGKDTVALGTYDDLFYRGRPAPVLTNDASGFRLDQSFWVLPPSQVAGLRTIRGIEVEEHVFTDPSIPDAIGVRLVFRNVTNRPAYQAVDRGVPAGGLTLEQAYVGFALDADIGVPGDDNIGYFPDLATSIVYDSDFSESSFGSAATRPGAVGMRLLQAPTGTKIVLNGYPIAQEWFAAQVSSYGIPESAGYHWLAGMNPDREYADRRIGLITELIKDWRSIVSAGPVRLAPGDSATVTLAIFLASPAAGTYTSGTTVKSGDPDDPTRQLAKVLAPLATKAQQVEAMR